MLALYRRVSLLIPGEFGSKSIRSDYSWTQDMKFEKSKADSDLIMP